MFKKIIILFLLCIFIFSFTRFAQAIHDDELMPFIGKEVTIGIYIGFDNSHSIIKIRGKLLNVIDGQDLFSGMAKYFAGYYAIVEFNSKIYPIPCKAIVYIQEIKSKENRNAEI